MRLVFILFAAFTAGCSTTPPTLDIPAQTASQTLNVSGHSRSDILSAVQQVFLWADPDDVTFSLTADGLTATRTVNTSSILPMAIKEEWRFTLTTPATLFVEATMTIAGKTHSPSDPAFFQLALNRVAYALHDTTAWETCQEFQSRTGLRQTFFFPHHHHQFLCLYADDLLPPNIQAQQSQS